jgi:hypothetical protein
MDGSSGGGPEIQNLPNQETPQNGQPDIINALGEVHATNPLVQENALESLMQMPPKPDATNPINTPEIGNQEIDKGKDKAVANEYRDLFVNLLVPNTEKITVGWDIMTGPKGELIPKPITRLQTEEEKQEIIDMRESLRAKLDQAIGASLNPATQTPSNDGQPTT